MKIRINNHKWNIYALFDLPQYAPFTLSEQETFDCVLRFYKQHKQVTNRQLIALFAVATLTLTCFREAYNHDLKRRNDYMTRLANHYAHCADKNRRIQNRLRWFMPRNMGVQIMIEVMWRWYWVKGVWKRV